MKHTLLYSFVAIAAASLTAFASRSAYSTAQVGALVRLQPTTPGVPQGGHANLAGTVTASAFQGGGSAITGISATNISSGTLSLARLPVPFGVSGSSGSGIIEGVNFASTANAAGVTGSSSAASGNTCGVFGTTSSPSGKGVFGWNLAATGINYGVVGESMSSNGVGVYGKSSIGGRFVSETVAGYGVFCWATATSGNGYGLYAKCDSTNGTGVYGEAASNTGGNAGVFGVSFSSGGKGVRGYAPATSGNTYGGEFINMSTAGAGVLGSATGSGGASGVEGQSAGNTGRGVYGFAGHASGANYGIYGQSQSGTFGYGVFSQGRTGASGTKAFRIDHPEDPLNRYLLHYSAEGPEPQNFYNGTAVTNGKGEAWIELPSYFESINCDFRYTLTVVEDQDSDQFVQAKVARKIKGNRFKVRTSSPNTEVCWRIDAVRNDPWVRRYGAPTEQEKPTGERGRYQHPELYDEVRQ